MKQGHIKIDIERVGEMAGAVLKPGLELAKKVLAQPEKIQYLGLKNLLDLGSEPYILAANHIKPLGAISQKSGLSPDALFLSSFVENHTGRNLQIIVKCDDGWLAEGPYRYFQKYLGQPLGHGLQIGLGHIPVKKNPGSYNRDLLRLAEKAKAENRPILIFPQGNWSEDFDPNQKMERGIAVLAKRLGLPILPAYICGCRSWHPKGSVDMAFGKTLNASSLSETEILSRLSGSISDLRTETKEKFDPVITAF